MNRPSDSSKFVIENDIPLSPRGHGRGPKAGSTNGSHLKYPFYAMKVGDSFFVPLADSGYPQVTGHGSESLQQHVVNQASQYRRFAPGKKFASRTQYSATSKTPIGLRVWRVK